ncbi:MAG: UTP--glucose-1-phosphate uridylyltransferase, partial [Rhodobacteraceae bacterium]
EFIFVTSRGKGALEDYFDRAPELEASLKAKGKTALLEVLEDTTMDSGAIAYVRQHQALGLGHAVWCARHLIGDEPFAVLLPDDVIAAEKPCLQQMVEAYAQTGGNMIAAMEVAPEKACSYGIMDVPPSVGRVLPMRGMVEKPAPGTQPSNLAAIGRYILSPQIMRHLGEIAPGAGGEVQLTDAIAREIAEQQNVYGYRFDGQRYDCGSKAGFLQATVAFGLARPDLGDELDAFLRNIMAQRQAAE